MPNIYHLQLHESHFINERLMVVRVPGGWLYIRKDKGCETDKSATFVPFDNEFMETSSTAELAATVPAVAAANSRYATALEVYQSWVAVDYGKEAPLSFIDFCKQRLHSDERHDA